MGRPPLAMGVTKKGPWTPQEDITLTSYIKQNGPGNWKFVPSTAGLQRCGKSCRLRWKNYLRPGIKRGNFTREEDRLIIHHQALLGNRWAAIAVHMPHRTDNDIKNHWHTHLKKQLQSNSNGSSPVMNDVNNNDNKDTSAGASTGGLKEYTEANYKRVNDDNPPPANGNSGNVPAAALNKSIFDIKFNSPSPIPTWMFEDAYNAPLAPALAPPAAPSGLPPFPPSLAPPPAVQDNDLLRDLFSPFAHDPFFSGPFY